MTSKEIKKIELLFKGVANQTRIAVLILVYLNPAISLDAISKELKCNVKTVSEHTRRLKEAGLIKKKARGKQVLHSLTPTGQKMIDMMKNLLK